MKYGTTAILTGDAREQLASLPAGHFHSCVTSPPYWGLRSYIDHSDEIGREPTLAQHLANLVDVFRGVKRVLRDDGTCWVNYGDVFDDGDLMLLPYRVAEALRADGWLVRSAIVWAKAISFCDTYSGSCMPESLNGWRWERCRVKVESQPPPSGLDKCNSDECFNRRNPNDTTRGFNTVWSDCPGCDKCNPHGGYVLRKSSWRPTSSYELVFLLAKAGGYFCDKDAVREKNAPNEGGMAFYAKRGRPAVENRKPKPIEVHGWSIEGDVPQQSGRNLRSVWTINPQAFPGSHFATYPEKLVEPIVKVSTSQKGCCPECGAPWARVVETTAMEIDRSDRGAQIGGKNGRIQASGTMTAPATSRTLGWRPTCSGCYMDGYNQYDSGIQSNTPCRVLDPFGGSGTTGLVANRLGRDATIIELNPEYAAIARDRIGMGLRPSTHRQGLRPSTYRDESAESDAPLFQES